MDEKTFQPNEGVTPSEQYLGRLCRNSFLSLWSYQGIYRDQDNGKEICDLLVIFGDHLLIFSDKFCEFPDTGDLQTDWNRWFKKAILKSAKQIWGAERWLKQYPDRVFIDQTCTRKLPLNLPPQERMKIHRIAVAHGAGRRCQQEFGGSGSLMINTSLVGEDHLKPLEADGMPFAVGLIDPQQGYVHVLDDTTLDIVLRTLDTIADFVAYLEKKELFFRNHSVFATGEEDLLGFYLRDVNEADEHDFLISKDIHAVSISEGFWENFLVSPERYAMQRANIVSYAWDALIEKISYHIANNTQHYTTHPGDINSNEQIIRFMAAEPRLHRRMLANKLYDIVVNTPKTHKAASVFIPKGTGSPYYIYLVLPQLDDVPYEEYREGRRMLLQAYCLVTKLKYPDAVDIVGIATEPGANEYSSEDAIYLDARDWTDEQQTNAESMQRNLDLLNSVTQYEGTEKQYPDTPYYGRKAKKREHKIPRNAPCPCGSGKKYKHCCLRSK